LPIRPLKAINTTGGFLLSWLLYIQTQDLGYLGDTRLNPSFNMCCVPQITHGSFGADFHKELDLRPVDLIIRKGSHRNIDSYSTFMENDKKTCTGLHSYLQGFAIQDLYFCGLATDYCVYYSAVDARNMGFNVSVILDACRGVDVPAGNLADAVQLMKDQGIRILNHDDLP